LNFKKVLRSERAFHSPSALVWYYKNVLFKDIELSNKRILDIGGGKGLTSLYCSISGASNVILLEPEDAGSQNDSIEIFRRLKTRLKDGVNTISHSPNRFQDFEYKDDPFDIVVLNSSINHLDENACIELQTSSIAQEKYYKIFNKMSSISKKGSYLIITDCSSKNFFNDLQIKNPFDTGIEWHKHQPPKIWIELIKASGYKLKFIKWTSLKPLKRIGEVFLGNRICSYFITSNFVLVMQKL